MRKNDRRSVRRRALGAAGFFAIMTMTGAVLVASAGAQSDAPGVCTGDIVIDFSSVVLRNVDGERSVGPFEVTIPAGTYTVMAASFEEHLSGSPSQPREQWQIRSDSGWNSPYTNDVPDNRQTSVTTFVNQHIPATASITLAHIGQGGVNSVTPLCVSFTLASDQGDCRPGEIVVSPEGEILCGGGDSGGGPTTVAPTTTGAPTTTTAPTTTAVNTTVAPTTIAVTTTSDAPATTGAPATTLAPTTTVAPTTSGAPATTDAPTTTAAPTTTTVAPTSSAVTPSTDADGEPIEPEVFGVVENPAQLARTGADPVTNRVLGLALMLLGLGGLARLWAHRTEYQVL